MSFSRKILVGLGAGILVGVFLGELVAPLGLVAEGFVRLLQMTVLPYVTVSIVLSLGRLDRRQALTLGIRTAATIAGLWAVALVFTFLFPLVFPPSERASFFSASLVERPPPFDFVNLYIPSNPFYSLANNIVPAVVLFSIVLGVALITIERKSVLLDLLEVLSATIAGATRFVVRLTPIGIFALAATAAGTLQLEQVQRIQVYLVGYVTIALLVALWVLPGLVAALTSIRYRDIMSSSHDAFITAFSAGDLFIVLPSLIESSRNLLARYRLSDERSATLPDVIVPASFNFPHTGKLLSLSFILFAGWFADADVAISKYPMLAVTGLLTFFGSLNAAVPFMLDLFRIPADTFQLFIATGVVNSRFGALVAAVHTVAVALIGSAAIAGTIRFDARRLLRYAVTTVVLTVLVVGGLRVTFRTWLRHEFKGAETVYGMRNALTGQPAEVIAGAAREDPRATLERIRARGTLRVAFMQPRLPFVFRNGQQELVGFDVEATQLLAADLGVKAVFIEWRADRLLAAVADAEADIGIGGNPLAVTLSTSSGFSMPYLDETAAFLVKDHLRERFENWSSIGASHDLVFGVVALPYYQRLIEERLPGITARTFGVGDDPLAARAGFDAVILPAERGAVLTMLNPQWTVVVPRPGTIKIPLAFPLGGADPAWENYVNTWIELKRRDGTLDALYDHWILGKTAELRTPRWSIARNVLHWVR